ncbi:MAG TPA: metallophosphoesterase, partial [Chloroflexota bacterium]|nr:metallophosphoesterase [Chloroflexota bacterium]
MLVGFIGDLHGRVFHALAAVLTWQRIHYRRFDLLIQVGDLGAITRLDQLDPESDPHLTADAAEADLARFLVAAGRLADLISHLKGELSTPIHFIRGNHEDFPWLANLPIDPRNRVAPADPFGVFQYVPDGTVLTVGDGCIAFLGGVEEEAGDAHFDERAYHSLLQLGPGAVDLLVTHEGPYGSSVGYRGDTHGSPLISDLVDALRPSFHVAGHAHQVSGPRKFGSTCYLGLDGIVASPR